MNTAEILENAATALDVFGHTKYVLRDFTGGMCALGAINYALLGQTEHPPGVLRNTSLSIGTTHQNAAMKKSLRQCELPLHCGVRNMKRMP